MTDRGPTTRHTLVYDTGALIAADRDVRRMWALHQRALTRGVVPVVAAGCLVEAERTDRQVSLQRLLAGCAVDHLDAGRARAAGHLLARATGHGAIDATVVEAALRRRAAVVTADRSDLLAIADAAGGHLDVIDI